MFEKYNKGSIAIPIAILVTGLLIGGAILSRNLGGGNGDTSPSLGGHGGGNTASAGGSRTGFRLASDDDHIRGNASAPVTIVEFSDFECPFCARFHPTLKRVVEESPNDVKWVYRHFPLSQIHSRARGAALASECVANLAGNDAFWQFADTMFGNQSNLGNKFYEETAKKLGVDEEGYSQCIKSKEVSAEVTSDLNEAVGSGGRGTPFAVMVTASGELFPFSGALPYEQIRSLVDQGLSN